MLNRFVLSRVFVLAVVATGFMIVADTARAALVIGGGASLYTNVLQGAAMDAKIDPGTGEVDAGPPTIGAVGDISNPSSQFNFGKSVRYVTSFTNTSITATLSSAADVGTIISTLIYTGPPGSEFSNGPSLSYSVNGSAVASSSMGLNPSGTFGGGIQIATLPSQRSGSSVTMTMSNVPYYGTDTTTHYADFRYFVALSDRLQPVTTLSATSSTPGGAPYLPGNTTQYASDPDNALVNSFYSPDDPGYLQISLGGTKTLDGVLLATYPGPGGSDLTIKDDLGNVVGTVSGTPNDTLLLPIKFNSPVTTSYLRFESVSGTGVIALNEVIPLTLQTPEPASIGFLSIGAVAVLLRRRRTR